MTMTARDPKWAELASLGRTASDARRAPDKWKPWLVGQLWDFQTIDGFLWCLIYHFQIMFHIDLNQVMFSLWARAYHVLGAWSRF